MKEHGQGGRNILRIKFLFLYLRKRKKTKMMSVILMMKLTRLPLTNAEVDSAWSYVRQSLPKQFYGVLFEQVNICTSYIFSNNELQGEEYFKKLVITELEKKFPSFHAN
jgi:hypothetical protein